MNEPIPPQITNAPFVRSSPIFLNAIIHPLWLASLRCLIHRVEKYPGNVSNMQRKQTYTLQSIAVSFLREWLPSGHCLKNIHNY